MASIGSSERDNYISAPCVLRGELARHICGVSLVAFIVCVALPQVGCGGGTPEPAVASADSETSKLVLLLKGRGSVAAAIEIRLRQAGYNVVSDSSTGHDAVVDVSERNVQNKSLFTVKVNGKESVSYTTHLTVSLRSSGGTLATASAEFDSDDGIDPDDLERIVIAITKPAVMTRLARNTRDRETKAAAAAKQKADEEEARKRAEKETAEEKARQEDEAAWAQVVVAECTNPTEETACDKVKDYLAKYSSGIHAAEAREAAERGTTAIATMLDERSWNAANVAACKEPEASTDCDAVKKYMNDHPTGAHVTEAREALDATRTKLEKLAKKEDREAEREAKRLEAEERKAALKVCKESCREACDIWRRASKRARCYNQCVPRECR